MTQISLSVLVVMTSAVALVTCAPTPAPSPQFPFTVLPAKGTSFRQPYRPPKEYFQFIRGLNYIKDLLFKPTYYSSPLYSSPYTSDSYISSPYYSSIPSFNGHGGSYDADDFPSQYYYKR